MRSTKSMSCPNWRERVAARDLEGEEARWQEALSHLDDCPDCRREAFAADPTLVFRRLPEPRVTAMDVDSIRRGVAALREASRLGETTRASEGKQAEPAAPPIFASLFDHLDAAGEPAGEPVGEASPAELTPLPFRPAPKRPAVEIASEIASEAAPAEPEKRVAAGGGGWRAWAPRVAAAGLVAVGLSLAPAALENGALENGTPGTVALEPDRIAVEADRDSRPFAEASAEGWGAGTFGTEPLDGSFADSPAYLPSALPAALPAGGSAPDGGSPLIENLDLPDPRVYQLAEEGVQVVMVIDSSLVDLDLEYQGLDS